ncbi:PIN domain-like protein, partial [Armillaria gallica]
MFAAKYHHGQTKNPAQASLFKRLGCLFHHPIHPLFVFDGPHRPVYKRKKKVDKTVDWLAADFKRLLDGFGFPYWDAPGEAEAELAMLSRADRIDAVMSEDFDAMIFGAQRVIRIKEESKSEYIIDVYEQGPQLFSSDLVVIALLAGGDYDDGLQGCGTQTAVDIALTGTGKNLFEAIETSSAEEYPAIAATWRQELCNLLHSKGAGRLSSRHRALASWVPLEFSKVSVLVQYIQPLISHS